MKAGILAAILILAVWWVTRGACPQYEPDPEQPWGPWWKDRRPEDIPPGTRKPSRRGAAIPHVRTFAMQEGLGPRFADAMQRLALNESRATFGLPSNVYGGREGWGVFQWNVVAWRHVTGDPRALPWEVSTCDELRIPIRRYAEVWREAKEAGAPDRYAERAVRLWQMAPSRVRDFLEEGRRIGWPEAWERVDFRPRGSTARAADIIDRKLA